MRRWWRKRGQRKGVYWVVKNDGDGVGDADNIDKKGTEPLQILQDIRFCQETKIFVTREHEQKGTSSRTDIVRIDEVTEKSDRKVDEVGDHSIAKEHIIHP